MGVWFSLLLDALFDTTPALPAPGRDDPERIFTEAVQIAARMRRMEQIREAGLTANASMSARRPTTRSATSATASSSSQTASRVIRKRIHGRLASDSSDDSSSASSSSEDESDDDGFVSTRRPRGERTRTRTNTWIVGASDELEKSYASLKSDLSLRCGCKCAKMASDSTCTCVPSLPLVLRAIELGGGMKAAYRGGQNISISLPGAVKACLCNRAQPNRRKVVEKVRTKTFCCYFLDEGRRLVTASQDSMIRFYDRAGPRQAFQKQREVQVPYVGWSILDLVVSPDGQSLAYCTWGDAVHQGRVPSLEDPDEPIQWSPFIFNADNRDPPHNLPEDNRFAVFSLRFSYDGRELLAGGSDRRVHVFDRSRATAILSIKAHGDDVNAVCFGDTASFLLYSGGDDGLVKVWDRRTMCECPVGVFAGHRDGITFIDARGDDRYLLSNCKDQTIKLWDLRCFSSEEGIEATRSAVSAQHWDYRWQCVPRGVKNEGRLEGDSSVVTMRGHSVIHTLVRARFSPESTGRRYIYTGCAKGDCVVYDMLAGEEAFRLSGHKSVVRDCVWSPVNNEIVTTSWDGETALWRYDERVNRSLNPDGGELGDEDSCDEHYRPLLKTRKSVKKQRCLRNESASSSLLSQLGPMRSSTLRTRLVNDHAIPKEE